MTKYNKRFFIYQPILFALILIIGIYIGSKLASVSSFNNDMFSIKSYKYNKISDIINYIEQDYVDSVNRKKLTEESIIGMLKELDPHSQYIPAEEFNEVNDQLLGNFEGIGIQFRIEKDTITVINTILGGPSEKSGIKAGDRIVKINDTLVAGIKIKNKDAVKKLKGKRGTKVKVSIFRRGVNELINFNIIRDVIPTYSLDIAYMINDSLGYIKLNKFSATTYDEFIKALKDLKQKGMTKLILDLRGNIGGYLQSAIKIADEFLEDKKLIVYTEGNSRPKNFAYATEKGCFEKNELIVLIDEESASASEIIAGAIQDNDRGLIIGRRSFGKGLVQEQLNFPDGSALRLTVARYHTPTGRCIQKSYENGIEDYYMEFYNRYTNGELENADSIHFDDSLKYITPGGKVVYGGGGIMPDIYVPIEKDIKLKYYNQLINKGLIFRYAFEYTDKNRDQLSTYKTFENFNTDFIISDLIFNDFLNFAEENGVKKENKGIEYANERIKILLKAFIGRNLLDDKGFYPIYHKVDKTFQKAVELL
ncbi:MAG: S41 family peptidase [Bacteroidales bacterium]|nr:S41 family peptidase [Bacteroidales bacterium]